MLLRRLPCRQKPLAVKTESSRPKIQYTLNVDTDGIQPNLVAQRSVSRWPDWTCRSPDHRKQLDKNNGAPWGAPLFLSNWLRVFRLTGTPLAEYKSTVRPLTVNHESDRTLAEYRLTIHHQPFIVSRFLLTPIAGSD